MCQRCTRCCRWPGEVKLTDVEVDTIAAYLGMDPIEFTQHHTALRRNRQGLTLLEKPNGECEFLDGNDCSINEVKPQQCRDFPNKWRFEGWRQVCEAIPVRVSTRDC